MYLRIYLCGPINGCSDDECTTWRQWFKDRLPRNLNFWAVDPMARDYRGREQTDYREIVELDKREIRSVDVLLAMYTKPSVGSAMEIMYAWTCGVPVIVINESEGDVSPWLLYHATSIVKTKEEALQKLQHHWDWKKSTWTLWS